MSQNEGKMPFQTRANHAMMQGSSYSVSSLPGVTRTKIVRAVKAKGPPMSAPLQIGLLIFPKVTQLDFTGPLQVFSGVPGAKVHLIWKRIEPVTTDTVMMLTPT